MDNEKIKFCPDCGEKLVLTDSSIWSNSEKFWYCRKCKKEVKCTCKDKCCTNYGDLFADEEEII